MMEYNRVQLKQAAKQAMKGQRPHPMLITLLYIILTNLGCQLVMRILGAASGSDRLFREFMLSGQLYTDPEDWIQYILFNLMTPGRLVVALLVGGVLATILGSLWMALMNVGYVNFCLGMVRRQQPTTGALFSVFPQFGPVLGTRILVGIFEFLWCLLFGVGAVVLLAVAVLLFAEIEVLMLLTVLAIYVALLVGIVWATLRYAMVDFLIVDRGVTGKEAIQESKRLMKGNIGRLFLLQLSFIGWFLLEYAIIVAGMIIGMIAMGSSLMAGGISGMEYVLVGSMLVFLGLLGIGVIIISIINLWLVPYINGTKALFYDWLQGADTARFDGGQGGWGQPAQQNYDYTRLSGPSSGTGIGPGPGATGPNPGGPAPSPPKSRKDDPWN